MTTQIGGVTYRGVQVYESEFHLEELSGDPAAVSGLAQFYAKSVDGGMYFRKSVEQGGTVIELGVGLTGPTIIDTSVDGDLLLTDSTGLDVNGIFMGGKTNAYPLIQRQAATVNIKLAGGGGFAQLNTGTIVGGNGNSFAFGVSSVWHQNRSDMHFVWSSDTTYFGTADLGLVRNAAGVLRVSDGSTGKGALVCAGLDSAGVGAGSFIAGPGASSAGATCVCIGRNAQSSGDDSVLIGDQPEGQGNEAVGVGIDVIATQGSTCVGAVSQANSGTFQTLLGYGSAANNAGTGGIGIGYNVVVGHNNAACIGTDSVTTAANRLTVGTISGTQDMELQVGLGFSAFGVTPPGSQPTKVSDPTGGVTQDSEARTAINAIIDVLEGAGLSAAV